jgi:hypothetical protein
MKQLGFISYENKKRDESVRSSQDSLSLSLSLFFCTRSRDRTGTALLPLVFETSASTNSAIRALIKLVYIIVVIDLKRTYPDIMMAELSTPAVWLLAKNTHRVFYSRSPLPSGH